MSELLIPVDAEVAAITELATALAATKFSGVHVGTKLPTSEPKPECFVRVTSAGGTRRDLVTDSHLLSLDGFAVREQDARDLTALCVAHIERAARRGHLGTAVCSTAGAAGLPANLPHPDVPTHFRFSATISADLRRTAV